MKTLVAVEGQTLRWYGKIPEIADNSVQFVQLEFSLPKDWADLVVVAQFSQTKTYNKLLENGCCYLPAELVAGPCEVSLFGQRAGETVRATSVPLRFKISRSGFTSTAENPIPPTPDLYAQLLEKLGHQGPSESVAIEDDGEGNVSFASGFEGDGEDHELKSFNTGKTVYTSFPDKVAREGLKGKLANPGGLTPGQLLRVKSVDQEGNILIEGVNMPSGGSSVVIDTTLTQFGQAADAKATGDAISKLSQQNGNYVLPVGGDELGGVKNGGSIIIGADGEMNIRDLWLDRRRLHLAETTNAPAKLPIKTHPSGGDQPIHPKVLYLPNKFGGHYFWMGYTPYPDGSDGEENPCIACSDDMVNWYTPDGVTNPLDAGTKIAYMSDTHLVYNERTAMLELWYRHVDTTNGGSETIYRRRSTNGSEWMEREKMYEHIGDISNIISPCILFEDGIYKIWASTGTPVGTLKYYETPDGRNWQLKAVTNLEGWHFDVIHTDIGYEAVIADTQPGATISYAVSPDGINWSDKTQLLSAGVDGNWDDDRLYRASIVKQDGYYYLYYTGVTWPTWGIGLTVSTQRNDVFSIRGYISGAVLVREYGADYGSQIAALNAELRDLIAGLDARIAAIENARWEVVDIELTPATLSIKQDEQVQLIATLYPEGAPVSLIGWRSDDPAVAMVDGKGLVTGIAPGACTITCYAKADETINAQCIVTVAAQTNILRGVKLNNGVLSYENGAIADSETDVYTDLAPVEGNTLMRINFASPTYNQGDPYRAVFYDADGVFVGAAHGNDPSIMATVPDGATQLRLGSHKAKLSEISIYGFDTITDYAESLKNQYYDSATGVITNGSNNNAVKVSVTAGREYRVVGSVSGCVLDASGTYISGWPFDNTRQPKTITPTADGYLCVNYTYSNLPTIYEIADRIGYLTVG